MGLFQRQKFREKLVWQVMIICMCTLWHKKQLHRANAQTFHWDRNGNAMKNTKKLQPQPHSVNGPSVDTAFASSVLISQDVKLANQSRVMHFFMDRQEYHKTDESQLKLSILLFRRLKWRINFNFLQFKIPESLVNTELRTTEKVFCSDPFINLTQLILWLLSLN